jgi:hypothetical protein
MAGWLAGAPVEIGRVLRMREPTVKELRPTPAHSAFLRSPQNLLRDGKSERVLKTQALPILGY